MKRFFMSAALLTLSLGSQAFAGTYAGGGDWNSNDGKTGTYTETVSGVEKDGNIEISKSVTVGEQTYEMKFTIQPVDDMRFKISVDGKTVGGGYCWHIGDGGHDFHHGDHMCHTGAKLADGTIVENTMHITESTIHEMGSKYIPATKFHVAWKGTLNAVEEEKN